MIGKTLAHYEIIAGIGRGGMGEVYRARQVLEASIEVLRVVLNWFEGLGRIAQ